MIALVLTLAVVVAFLHHIRETKRATDLQISGLLNRIQAPEKTVALSLVEDTPATVTPLHTTFDDDESYWDGTERPAA